MLLQKTYSPVDNSLYVERPLATNQEASQALEQAQVCQKNWASRTLAERAEILNKFANLLEEKKTQLAIEITWQMGRPLSDAPNEIVGAVDRARTMIHLAEEALAPTTLANKNNKQRYLIKQPLGVVFIIAPWNYPYLTAINSLVPALMAGNSVLLKHSSQTPLVAERLCQLLTQAGLPKGVCQYLHLSHSLTQQIVKDPAIKYLAFTGSVAGGYAMREAQRYNFNRSSLELGGKDSAYVCSDVELNKTVAQLVDGAFYNSGQSCCGIERIYVDQTIYNEFISEYAAQVASYNLGNPTDPSTTLGPVVRSQAANFIRSQVDAATKSGARALINSADFHLDDGQGNYCSPQVMVDVNHDMAVMREESFGPVVGIMPVVDEQTAISLMNDSNYGLTASIWTKELERAERIGREIQVGTFFMNGCDYLDPELAWTGVKETGVGCSLSKFGYDHVTRLQSFNLNSGF